MVKRKIGFLKRTASWLAHRFAGLAHRAQKYAGLPLRDPALVAMFGGAPVAAGVDVDEDTALNFSAVWRAVNIIASTTAMLPRSVSVVEGERHTTDTSHPAHRVVAIEPNPEMTSLVFHETVQAHALVWGNGIAHIERDGDPEYGPVIATWPLMPDQMRYDRDDKTNEIIYHFIPRFPGEVEQRFKPREILHVPGLSFDGLRGYSVVHRAREAIGLGVATERYGASFFGRGAAPGGIITHPGDLSRKAKKNIRETWELLHRGPDNSWRIGVLDEGMTFSPTDMPHDDAQFLQTRQFQIVEIARWFGVPPHMLYDLVQSTNNNIEHQGMDFLIYTLLHWLMRWQQEYKRKLFDPVTEGNHTITHDTTLLVMADIKTRYEAYTQGRNGGWLTLNNILKREGMNPLPSEIGDTRLAPSTMRILGEKNPEAPLDPETLKALVEMLKGLKPLPWNAAKEIVRAVCPTVTDKFTDALLAKLKSDGTVQGEAS